jgi:Protein of unknown function (DUF3016)
MHPKLAGVTLLVSTSLVLASCQGTSTPVPGNGVTASDITVNFKDPAGFTDVRDTLGGPPVQAYLDLLARHLQERAPAFLRTGQHLTVTFNDIDLAGDFPPDPPAGRNGVRIIRDLYCPRLDLYFALYNAKGRLIKDGARVLQDLNFQSNPVEVMTSQNEPLAYDKKLLTDWLENEFPAAPASRRYSDEGLGLGSSPGSEPWLRDQSTTRGSVEDFRQK